MARIVLLKARKEAIASLRMRCNLLGDEIEKS